MAYSFSSFFCPLDPRLIEPVFLFFPVDKSPRVRWREKRKKEASACDIDSRIELNIYFDRVWKQGEGGVIKIKRDFAIKECGAIG